MVKVPSGLRSALPLLPVDVDFTKGQLLHIRVRVSGTTYFAVARAVRGMATLGGNLTELVLGEVGEVGRVGRSHD